MNANGTGANTSGYRWNSGSWSTIATPDSQTGLSKQGFCNTSQGRMINMGGVSSVTTSAYNGVAFVSLSDSYRACYQGAASFI